MTDIDVATGLPKLPESQFWRVRDRKPTHYDRYDNIPPFAVVELVERTTVEVREPRFIFNIQVGHYPLGKKVVEKSLAYQLLWDPEKKTPAEYEGWAITVGDEKFLPIPAENIKPEFILAAAEKALAWYQGKVAAEALLGDYPPKSLVQNAESR